MEREQAANMLNEERDERYQRFAERERQFAAEIGERALDRAQEGKRVRTTESTWAQERIEQYQQKVEQLRDDIDAKKKNLITRIVQFKQLRQLQKELRFTEDIVAKSAKEQQWRQEMIEYYDRIVAEEEVMGHLMEEAYAENDAFDERKRIELIEEENGRSVAERAKKHGVFFVSDIVTAEWKPSENNRAIKTKGLDFEEQLNILLGVDPTISVSTLSPDSKNRTFGDGAMGVLLSGGRIVGGEESDAASVAMGLRSRYIEKRHRTVAAIDKAIERPWGGGKENSTSYNELVVEQPEVAGIYFKLDRKELEEFTDAAQEVQLPPRRYGDAWWERINAMIKTGVPIFVIEQDVNNVRAVHDINLKERSFKVTPSYDPGNIVNMPGVYQQHLDREHKVAAMSRVFDTVAHLLSDDERAAYERDKDRGSSDNFINVY